MAEETRRAHMLVEPVGVPGGSCISVSIPPWRRTFFRSESGLRTSVGVEDRRSQRSGFGWTAEIPAGKD